MVSLDQILDVDAVPERLGAIGAASHGEMFAPPRVRMLGNGAGEEIFSGLLRRPRGSEAGVVVDEIRREVATA
jgi:hypothetical protein